LLRWWLLNAYTAAARILVVIARAEQLKTQLGRPSLLPNVSIAGAHLHQSYGPRVYTAATPDPGCLLYVCVQMIFVPINIFDVATLVVEYRIVRPKLGLALAPNAHFKSKTWWHAA
jgi:hypothetical protein